MVASSLSSFRLINWSSFYDNVYYLFSIGRVCNYVEELRKLGTVAVVELRSFFGRNNAENFTDLLDWNR